MGATRGGKGRESLEGGYSASPQVSIPYSTPKVFPFPNTSPNCSSNRQ